MKFAESAALKYEAQLKVKIEFSLIEKAKGSLEITPEGAVKPACFTGKTLIQTYGAFGVCQSHIEDLWIGVFVLSRCEKTGVQAYRRIVDFFEHEDRPIWKVTHIDERGHDETLYTTAEHPLWVKGLGWTPVSQLRPGQLLEISNEFIKGFGHDLEKRTQEEALLTLGRGTSTVVNVQEEDGYREKVYNFEVEDFHTYFVGELGAWVHNKKPVRPVGTGA